ncbi:TolC family protein [Chitinilyticum aquatile]|uniref:TolC family protein n=1 Tax=Chitinilyticum aquatile TaxID=362520 RepID=UPI00040FF212|nr:TolC family protein [Chitinilyticum aquatile]
MRVSKYTIPALFLLSLCSSAADLQSSWLAARNQDPQYLAAQAERRAGQARADQATALWRPQLGLTASAGWLDMNSQTRGAQFSAPGMGTFTDATFSSEIKQGSDTRWTLSASQPLYDPVLDAQAAQLRAQAELAESLGVLAGDHLMQRVATTYLAVLLAREELDTARVQLSATQEALALAEEEFRVGKRAVTDLREAQASRDAQMAQLAALQDELAVREARYTDLTGLSAEGMPHLPLTVSLDVLRPSALEPLLSAALSSHQQLRVAASGKRIAEHESAKYAGLSSPTLALVAQYGQQRSSGKDNTGYDNDNGWVGVALGIPLYTGGMREARYAESQALAEKALQAETGARIQVMQNVRTAWYGLNTALAQSAALQQALESARLRLEATATGREVGARTTLDWLNARQAYYLIRSQLVRARYQALESALNLALAAGNNQDDPLARINALLSD